jgi:hypothetical protein
MASIWPLSRYHCKAPAHNKLLLSLAVLCLISSVGPRYRTFICRRRSLLLAANSIVYRFFKFNLIFPSKEGRQITYILHLDQVCQALQQDFVLFSTSVHVPTYSFLSYTVGTVLYKFYNGTIFITQYVVVGQVGTRGNIFLFCATAMWIRTSGIRIRDQILSFYFYS